MWHEEGLWFNSFIIQISLAFVFDPHNDNREVKFDDKYEYGYEQTKEIKFYMWILEIAKCVPKTIYKRWFYQKSYTTKPTWK